VAQLCAAHGRRAPPVLRSVEVASPAVVGVLKPAILLPQALACGEDALTAALLHETAHVLRHDYAANLACELISLPLGWHPALLALKAGVRKSRELACDAMAAAALGSEKAYARRLVALARRLHAPGHPTLGNPTETALAVGLFGRSDLEDRLMHLMKPRETEAPALAAARLSGLAAMGAGLLGSAALLHVTPVLAQVPAPPPAPVAQAPLPPPAAATATPKSATPSAPAHHSRLMVAGKGVLITSGESHAHSWKAADGRTMTALTDSAAEPTPEQERAWETEAANAEARAAAIEAKVNSPEFKAKVARAEEAGRRAQALVESPEFKAKVAAAQASAVDVEKLVGSPEFKAKIAEARARALEVQKVVDSPEFKARIAEARAAAREAAAAGREIRDEARDTPSTKVRP
jgi:hypothetical protein